MHIGMLWFDNGSTPLAVKIINAAEYYQRKYGMRPNFCAVHPDEASETQVNGVRVTASRQVLRGHLWIGVEDGGRG